MLPNPFGECFIVKKSVRMLGKTRDCPLTFFPWLVYSFLLWKRRYDEGLTATSIAKFTGLDRSSTVMRPLTTLQDLRLATKQGKHWRALPQPTEPTGEVKVYEMGELVQIMPAPPPAKPWFAKKKKQPKYKHSPSWGLYLPTREAPVTVIQCAVMFLLNSYRVSTYPAVRVKRRTHAQLGRMLGVHQETPAKALLTLEQHGFVKPVQGYYELLKPDAERLAWFRNANRPSFMQPQEWEKPTSSDPKETLMLAMGAVSIPAMMIVEIVKFCEQNGVALEVLDRTFRELQVVHKQNQLAGRFTEVRHCGFLLKARLEKTAKENG